ncbi:MAG TPA: hypothetical protein VLD65_12325 [Anaerolineales bacterium]|nr:hypothetical protein [Anaerolineales bacterium]
MKLNYRWVFVILCIFCLPLAACGQAVSVDSNPPKPLTIEHLDSNSEPTREILTMDAVKRLDLQVAPVQSVTVNGKMQTVIPYASILYDTQGSTWVYVNTAPQTYVRHLVIVEDINGDEAILSNDELSQGTQVVTQGAEELFGAEFEFEEE